MKITTRLLLTTGVSVVTALLIGWALFIASQQVSAAINKNRVAHEVVTGVFQLNILTNDYLAHPTERPRKQWQLKHSALARLLLVEEFDTPEGQALVRQIQQDHESLKPIFSDLVANYQPRGVHREHSALSQVRAERLTGHLLTVTHDIVSRALRLASMSRAQILRTQERAAWLVMVSTVIILAAISASSLLIRRSIVKPISILDEGTKIIASGNLQHRVDIRSRDEIGHLARALNAMTEEMQTFAGSLERRVAERTEQLEAEQSAAQKSAGEAEEATRRAEDAEEAVKALNQILERRARALARSNTELEQFAYVASHDLQEPLRKIQAFGERLKATCAGCLNYEGRDYLQRMEDAATRMRILITDLLTLSRLTSKPQHLIPVDLTQVARDAVFDLEPAIQEAAARVEVGDLPTIDADPLHMRQLLQNLISNSIKFSSAEQTPLVKVHSTLTESAPDGRPKGDLPSDERCQIIVEDNGIGFEEKYLERIFSPFQRLHGRGEFPGTGMGLAICRKVAEHYGGTITAKSAPHQGATFIVTLPLRQPKGDGE